MSWAPIRYAVSRPLVRTRGLRALAVRSWEHAPAVAAITRPAVFDERELDRVVAVERQTTLPYEMSRVRGGRTLHAATRVHLVRGVTLAGSYLYARGGREQVADPRATPWLPRARVPYVPRGAMCGSVVASTFFGHWVTDQLTAELLARSLGVPAFRSAHQAAYVHEAEYRAALTLEVHHGARVRFGELLLFDDYGQNESKRARYASLRAALRRGAAPRDVAGVFVDRGARGAPRRLVNRDAVVARLAAEGFAVVSPERDGLPAMRDALHDARVVVGVEGSALAHAIALMPAHGRLLVLQPPDRFNNVHKDYADCLGIRYGFTVGDRAAGGFALPVERVLRAVDRLDRE